MDGKYFQFKEFLISKAICLTLRVLILLLVPSRGGRLIWENHTNSRGHTDGHGTQVGTAV